MTSTHPVQSLIKSFAANDMPLLKRLVAELDQESLVELPTQLHSINARLSQILAETGESDLDTELRTLRDRIVAEITQQIQICQTKIRDLQAESRAALDNLSKGARLLGSYRIGAKGGSRIIDSDG